MNMSINDIKLPLTLILIDMGGVFESSNKMFITLVLLDFKIYFLIILWYIYEIIFIFIKWIINNEIWLSST